jgi:glycosyltransferase involved in cell wall biosynthesis
VAGRITWTGMLQGALKAGALQAAEVFVLPSHQENFGIAVAEALAVGRPVLISQRVNIWREIVDAGAGFAEADTIAGTQALLERWLALPARERAAMGERAHRCYREHFHIDAAAQRLIATIAPHLRTARPLQTAEA